MWKSLFKFLVLSLMSWAAITGSFASQSSTANQASHVLFPDKTYNVGEVVFLFIAVDNNSGSDAAVTSVTDAAGGNTWVVYDNASVQNTAQAGATGVLVGCKLSTAIGTSTGITVNFSNSASRDKSAIIGKGFTVASGSTITKQAFQGAGNIGGDPGGTSISGLTSQEYLFLGMYACETNDATALTPSTNFTNIIGAETSGGGAAANIAIRAEYRILTGTGASTNPTYVSCDNVSMLFAFKEVAGGTTFTQNLGGSVTAAGALKKDAAQKKTGSISIGGIAKLSKITFKALAGSITPSGVSVKTAAKVLGGSLTPAGSLLAQRVFLQPLAGSVTPAGALKKDSTKQLAGSIAGSGAIEKSTSKKVAGSITAAGAIALAKFATKQLAGSIAASGAIAKQAAKSAGGVITPAGSIAFVKSFFRTFTGSITASGAIAKATSKRVAGSSTPIGTAIFVKAFFKALTGSVSTAGSLAKSVDKRAAGSVTPAGSDKQSSTKQLAGSIAGSGAIAKSTAKKVAGSTSPAGSLASLKSFTKQLTGSIAASGTVTRAISIFRSGSVTPSGLLKKLASIVRSGSVTAAGSLSTSQPNQVLNVGGSVTPSGSTRSSIAKQFNGSISASGAIAKSTSVLKSGVITAAGLLVAVNQKLLTVGGSVTAAGTAKQSIGRSVFGSVTPSGVLTRSISKKLGGVITAAGNLLTQLLGAIVAGDVRSYMQLSADVTAGIDAGISTELLPSAIVRTWLQEDPE